MTFKIGDVIKAKGYAFDYALVTDTNLGSLISIRFYISEGLKTRAYLLDDECELYTGSMTEEE